MVGLIIQLAALALSPLAMWDVAFETTFVKTCPSQYGPLILVVFVAGLIAIGSSFAYDLILDRNLREWTKVCLVAGTFTIGYLIYGTWTGGLAHDGRFDEGAAWAVLLASLSLAGNAIEYYRGTDTNSIRGFFLGAVDIPFFVGCVSVFFFRLYAYDQSSDAYNSLMQVTFPTASGAPQIGTRRKE